MQHQYKLVGSSRISKSFENEMGMACAIPQTYRKNDLTFGLFFREFNSEENTKEIEENYENNIAEYKTCVAKFGEILGIPQSDQLGGYDMDGAPYLYKETKWKAGGCTLGLAYGVGGLEYGISITADIMYNDKLTEEQL